MRISGLRVENSAALSALGGLLGGPTLFHQVQQMGQGFVVGFVLLLRELMGALVELRGHLT